MSDFEMDRIIGEQMGQLEHLAHENKRLRDFIESITDATGPYPELNGKPIIRAAYKALQELNAPKQTTGEK